MHFRLFQDMMARCAKTKERVYSGELSDAGITAQASGELGELRERAQRLLESASKATPLSATKAPAAAVSTTLPEVRTLEQLTAELNALGGDPILETLWWRQNFQAIKIAQMRARCAESMKPRGAFLNITTTQPEKKI
jgi:hypothetical protein